MLLLFVIHSAFRWRHGDHKHEDQTLELVVPRVRWSESCHKSSELPTLRLLHEGGNVLYWVQFSSSVVSDCLRPHGLQHARPPCSSPTPGAYSNSCPSSQWCHPIISSSVFPFSSCLQSSPASGYFLVSQFFTSGGQSIRVSASASVLPMNIQNWFPLG